MRYCTACRRLTAGDPVFCSHCGGSYDVRLCPRLHPNPRTALVCSQCGSRDLTEPQPRSPLSTRVLVRLLVRAPGIALLVLSVVLFVAFLEALLTNQAVQGQLFVLLLLLGLAWWAYTQLPGPVRGLLRRGWGVVKRARRRP